MTPDEASTLTLHANCVLLGEAGVLIRGRAGGGKSTLARRLVEDAARRGAHAAHVADDRVVVSLRHGRLVAEPHPAIAGRMEIRELGIVPVAHASAAVLRLVVDLLDIAPRLPDPEALEIELLGERLPRVRVSRDAAPEVVGWRLRGRDDTLVTVP